MRQYITFGLLVHDGDVVFREVDWLHPVAAGVDNLNLCGSSLRAARDQHRHQAYG